MHFFHHPAVFFILPLKYYLKQACVQETPSVKSTALQSPELVIAVHAGK